MLFAPVCDPSNNYGLAWASGEWGQPPGNSDGYSSFPATVSECCAACFTTTGCAFFEFFEEECHLTTFGGGPVTNPYNNVCPNGVAGFNFAPGSDFNPPANVFAEGPCSGPYTGPNS